MKKIFILVVMAVVFFSVSPALAAWDAGLSTWGQTVGQTNGQKTDFKAKATLYSNLPDILGALVQGVLILTGTIFLVLTVYAGILWMTAAGKEDQLKKAQGLFLNSIIGMLIIFAAYAITALVMNQLQSASGVAGCCRKTSPDSSVTNSYSSLKAPCDDIGGVWKSGPC